MEEMEMTALSLGTGTTAEHSKSIRGSGCKPKPPVRFHDKLSDQLKVETDHEGNDNSSGHARKKLRLSEDQLTVLETVYEEQTNLDPAQKQGLAEKLDLKPRQVEVWFQNRRARSKQKKMTEDCENLKKRAEVLIKENKKLKRKLLELTSVSQPDLKLPDSTHSGSSLVPMCSSCNKRMRRFPHFVYNVGFLQRVCRLLYFAYSVRFLEKVRHCPHIASTTNYYGGCLCRAIFTPSLPLPGHLLSDALTSSSPATSSPAISSPLSEFSSSAMMLCGDALYNDAL
ncbi:homeobox-leucine zipper protein HOX15-like [Phragmites australis]|uniref:homeobox-leucine zipper protein HOX15-like n=1 Tax=Phragmites australis TaxID=29695 RepID=UPI002D76D760|nr:homeobox-leucine zipper protein HOX15-like [Phragmites australis]